MKRFVCFLIVIEFSFLMRGTPRLLYEYSFLYENKKFILVHHWSLKNAGNEVNYADPFNDEKNQYAYFVLIEKSNGQVVMKKKSSFFTYGWIDEESKYIVLLSNTDMNEKTPKVALLSIDGNLIFERNISLSEVILNDKEYYLFKEQYPKYFNKLIEEGCISSNSDRKEYYIDALYTEDPQLLKYLETKTRCNHLFNCISVTTNKLLIWYSQKLTFEKNGHMPIVVGRPNVMLNKKNSGEIVGISITDPCEKRITILITRKDVDGVYVPIR